MLENFHVDTGLWVSFFCFLCVFVIKRYIQLSLVFFFKKTAISVSSRVVEFKDEEFVKKALESMNKYDLNGRPLNIKEVCM